MGCFFCLLSRTNFVLLKTHPFGIPVDRTRSEMPHFGPLYDGELRERGTLWGCWVQFLIGSLVVTNSVGEEFLAHLSLCKHCVQKMESLTDSEKRFSFLKRIFL